MKNNVKLIIGINCLVLILIVLIAYLYKDGERNKYEEDINAKVDLFFTNKKTMQDGQFTSNTIDDGEFYEVEQMENTLVVDSRIIDKSSLLGAGINVVFVPYVNSFKVIRVEKSSSFRFNYLEFKSGFLGVKNRIASIDNAYRSAYNVFISESNEFYTKGTYDRIENLLDLSNKYYYLRKETSPFTNTENISNNFIFKDFIIEYGLTSVSFVITLDREVWFYQLFKAILIGVIFQIILNLGLYFFKRFNVRN